MTTIRSKGYPAIRRWLVGSAIALALLGFSGCGGTTTSGTSQTVTRKQVVDHLVISLVAPEKPLLLTEQEFVVTLTDPSGKPVEGAEVWLGLVMPTMQHSPNEPDAVPAGQGQYKIRALFTMAGNWNMEVHATVQGQEYVATFRALVA